MDLQGDARHRGTPTHFSVVASRALTLRPTGTGLRGLGRSPAPVAGRWHFALYEQGRGGRSDQGSAQVAAEPRLRSLFGRQASGQEVEILQGGHSRSSPERVSLTSKRAACSADPVLGDEEGGYGVTATRTSRACRTYRGIDHHGDLSGEEKTMKRWTMRGVHVPCQFHDPMRDLHLGQ